MSFVKRKVWKKGKECFENCIRLYKSDTFLEYSNLNYFANLLFETISISFNVFFISAERLSYRSQEYLVALSLPRTCLQLMRVFVSAANHF